jgi:predicted nucleic acid-binding protein
MRIEQVVVNASPLICLCKSGLSNILPSLFDEIVIPAPVYEEVTAKGDIEPDLIRLSASNRINKADGIVIPTSITAWDLGEGESSVVAFAIENPQFYAVIDDLEARRCAIASGCRYTGTVGVILLAKRRGIILSVKDCLFKLRSAGLWLSDDFIKAVCQKAEE